MGCYQMKISFLLKTSHAGILCYWKNEWQLLISCNVKGYQNMSKSHSDVNHTRACGIAASQNPVWIFL
jgi:hypothetical protein